jgi:NAD(P)-dependent dehydrogenase (short-subunit alcohol dehydrogenase family)
MTLNLNGKMALVTGGARGIGRAIAERLAQAGAAVAICSLHAESVREGVTQIQAHLKQQPAEPGGRIAGMQADVSDRDSVARLFEWLDGEWGGLDILVNNAGIGVFKDLGTMQADEWRAVLGTNLDGAYYCIHEALPRLRKRGGGWIVNISSLAGKNTFAGGAAYNASKFGLCGLAEAVMLDHRYEEVKVTTILPGSVDTEFGRGGGTEWKIAPEDVADAVAMVLSMPARTLISHVEMRPSKPPKK